MKSKELPSLNGIRAICIALVIGAHMSDIGQGFPASWRPAAPFVFDGNLGVRIFFVLSGFLITFLLVQEEQKSERISLKRFYVRRILRIVPVCYAYILVFAVLDHLLRLDFPRSEYVAALTYTKDFTAQTWLSGHLWFLTHLWSLSVEEQFYLFWPFVVAFASRRGRLTIAVTCIAVAPVLRVVLYFLGLTAIGKCWPFVNMDSLMVGAIAGILAADRSPLLDRILHWRTGVGRFIAAMSIWAIWLVSLSQTALRWKLGWFTLPFGDSVQALAAAYLITSYALVREGTVYRFLNLAWMRYIGVLSYSLYIWQQLFTGSASSYGGFHTRWLEFPYSIVPIFVTAWCSYNLLELPLMQLRNKFRSAELTEPVPVEAQLTVDVASA